MPKLMEAGPGQSPSPKYRYVKQVVLARIADGTWRPGTLLPPEPEFCQEFGVSRITVRKALGDLAHEGKVHTVQGKGTFVSSPKLGERFVQRAYGFYEDMARRGLHLETQVLRQEVIPAPQEVADRLGLRLGTRVHVLVRLRSVDGEKLLISTTYVPEALCPPSSTMTCPEGRSFVCCASGTAWPSPGANAAWRRWPRDNGRPACWIWRWRVPCCAW